jgi:hypothetical protein
MDALIPSWHEFKNSGNIYMLHKFLALFFLAGRGGGGTVNVTANILFTGRFSKVA